MSGSGEAAEQIVHIVLDGIEYSVRIFGRTADTLARFVKTMLGSRTTTEGKTAVNELVRNGKPLTVFTLPSDKLKDFDRIAKRFGISYCVGLNDGKDNGTIDIIAEKEHSSRIERILEKYLPEEEKKEEEKPTQESPEREENETEGEYIARLVSQDEKKTDEILTDIPEVFEPEEEIIPAPAVKQEREEKKKSSGKKKKHTPRISKNGKKHTHGTRKKKEKNVNELRKIPQRTPDR